MYKKLNIPAENIRPMPLSVLHVPYMDYRLGLGGRKKVSKSIILTFYICVLSLTKEPFILSKMSFENTQIVFQVSCFLGLPVTCIADCILGYTTNRPF